MMKNVTVSPMMNRLSLMTKAMLPVMNKVSPMMNRQSLMTNTMLPVTKKV